MLRSLLLALSTFIIVRDFLTHRISNISTLLLSTMLYFSPHQSGVKITLVAIAAASILFYIAKIGMGDLKLLMGLLITQGALVISRSYLYLSICALLATLISQLIYRRTLQGSVAFAHVILLPFIIIYLAI